MTDLARTLERELAEARQEAAAEAQAYLGASNMRDRLMADVAKLEPSGDYDQCPGVIAWLKLEREE